MLTLADIRGQERVIDIIRRAVAEDRVPHAYLFTGPAGVGKMSTALALATALECTDAPGEGCGQCVQCQKVGEGIHPDVRILERQGALRIIPIETIRHEVIARIGTLPHEGAVRVFLIEEATALPDPSANALLKTLEEPPTRTHFVLCTTAPDQLLPTIRSRCQRVNFASLGAELRASFSGDDEGGERTLALAAALGKAVNGPRWDLESVYEVAREVASERAEMVAALERFAQDLHQAARRAALADDLDEAVRRSRQAAIVLQTEYAVTHNAHGQLALEAMLHELRATIG
ncbi:DNA polymerase III subunit delta' [Haliangium sp.]|uniref:DNA polymerase III subunit delta' n=1 Tax=Haliangium sp. TaxID=2663208 RepID=UPI003D11AD9F